jgi:hypothetical protein
MGLAILYPEPKRGMHSELRNLTEKTGLTNARLSQARSVLRHSRELAEAVRDGSAMILPGSALRFDRRVEMRALHFGADAMHDAGADLAAAAQRAGDLLQEGVASIDAYRPRGGHDGGKLVVG